KLAGELGAAGAATTTPVQKAYAEVVNAIDMTRQLADSQMEVARMKGELKAGWTPRQMLDVWAPLLRAGADEELAKRALLDAERAAQLNGPLPEAGYVKGLAQRGQGDFDGARATLAAVAGDAKAPEAVKKAAADELRILTQPSAFFVP